MLRSMLIATFVVGLQGLALAQTPEINADPASPGDASGAEGAAAEAANDTDGEAKKEDGDSDGAGGGGSRFKPLPGDVVLLKNGKSITGIQVLRETPVAVEIVTAPGEPPLRVPRKQVLEVQYDDLDPSRLPEPAPAAPAAPDVMEGNELEPAFHANLTKPLSDQPIVFENTDIVAMMRDLRQRAGIGLALLPGVHNTPVEQRQWTITIPAGKTMMALLQEDFATKFPQFQVVFEFSRVVIKTAEDVIEPAPAAPAPAQPAPAAG